MSKMKDVLLIVQVVGLFFLFGACLAAFVAPIILVVRWL